MSTVRISPRDLEDGMTVHVGREHTIDGEPEIVGTTVTVHTHDGTTLDLDTRTLVDVEA